MFTAKGLLEFHSRGHQTLKEIIKHCRQFSVEEINHEFKGFGYPSLRLQLHHLISAEKYWISVLNGRIEVDDNISEYSTIKSLEEYRQEVFLVTEQYLCNASTEELINARSMMTWGDNLRELVPAQVFMRTLTHIYHHVGQVVAICRVLEKPIDSGMDYPIT